MITAARVIQGTLLRLPLQRICRQPLRKLDDPRAYTAGRIRDCYAGSQRKNPALPKGFILKTFDRRINNYNFVAVVGGRTSGMVSLHIAAEPLTKTWDQSPQSREEIINNGQRFCNDLTQALGPYKTANKERQIEIRGKFTMLNQVSSDPRCDEFIRRLTSQLAKSGIAVSPKHVSPSMSFLEGLL